MYGGKIVETGSAVEVLKNPRHTYTRALLQATIRGDVSTDQPMEMATATPPAGCPRLSRRDPGRGWQVRLRQVDSGSHLARS